MIEGPAFESYLIGSGLPKSKRRALLTYIKRSQQECAPLAFSFYPEVKPFKEREKRKEDQNSLSLFLFKLVTLNQYKGTIPRKTCYFGSYCRVIKY